MQKRWRRCIVEIFHVIIDTLFEKQKENKVSGSSGKKPMFLPAGFSQFAAQVNMNMKDALKNDCC